MSFYYKILNKTLLTTVLAMSAMAGEKIGGDLMFTPIEHASVVIQGGGKVIYVDPVGDLARYAEFPKPDLVLITHHHHDHLAPALVSAVKKPGTAVIGAKTVVEQLGYGEVLGNGEKTTVDGIGVEAVPAYNTSPDRTKFHPKGRDNGYALTLNGKRIYISGDTEDVDEIRKLTDVDLAFICVNLPYTMTVEQAASLALAMKPKVVVPYHYRGQNGMSDLDEFKRLVSKNPDIEVRLLDWYGTKPLKTNE